MYYRRRLLISLIAAFGKKGVTELGLQKLLFLFCQTQEKPIFNFVPYKYGCFSFQASRDIQVLNTHYKLLVKTDDDRLIFDGNPALAGLKEQDEIGKAHLLKEFAHCDDTAIVNHVYDRFPYFSIHSQWDMSERQKEAARQKRKALHAQNERVLFTIGYEGRDIDSYLNLLIENHVGLLCDVRRNALSMKYGFSKKQIEWHCQAMGIHYVHLPEFGIASQKRQNLGSSGDYRKLFAEYEKKLPTRQTALERLTRLLEEHNRVALTCFEKAPDCCHRHCVSDYLETTQRVVCRHL